MYLSRLALTDFRNYSQLDISLGPGLFLFYGDNAQGKTHLLEAVGMLAKGSSFHATSARTLYTVAGAADAVGIGLDAYSVVSNWDCGRTPTNGPTARKPTTRSPD